MIGECVWAGDAEYPVDLGVRDTHAGVRDPDRQAFRLPLRSHSHATNTGVLQRVREQILQQLAEQ